LLVGGLGLIVGGGVYAYRELNDDHLTKGPFILAGAGLLVALVARSVAYQPKEPEAYRLAREYNDKLRAHLGLPPLIEDPTRPRTAAVRWWRRLALVPALAPQGGGLMMLGAF
jgi:hypothetical protein